MVWQGILADHEKKIQLLIIFETSLGMSKRLKQNGDGWLTGDSYEYRPEVMGVKLVQQPTLALY